MRVRKNQSEMTQEQQMWHDFILGVHMRSCRSVDDSEWTSWEEAGKTFYGEEKYESLYRAYTRYLSEVKDGTTE